MSTGPTHWKRACGVGRAAARKIVFKILRYLGLPLLFREIVHRSDVTILLFHDMPPDKAKSVLNFLQRTYNIIGLSTFVEQCISGGNDLPPKSLVLTLDDGHIGNRALLPLVTERGIPVTVFLCGGVAGTNRHFWCQQCSPHYAVSQLQCLPNAERLRLLQSVGFTPEREYEEPQALTRIHIQEMKPHFDFQAHTLFHPSLPGCSDEEARHEIFECKRILETEFHLKINAISFPHGAYSDRDIELCQQAGYQCGLTADDGFNTTKTPLFRLKRISMDDADGIDELSVKASGLWRFIRNLKTASSSSTEPIVLKGEDYERKHGEIAGTRCD
jgi:peptidoglycan/xylan/chitin deacetylase (PgdA/CDA1 family)